MIDDRLIPFFNYPDIFQKNKTDYMNIIQDVLARGAYIMQDELFKFENDLAKFLGIKHVVGVADGTMGILIAIKSSGICPGDEVILPAHTFVATAAAVHHAGAIPVLADCGKDHLISPQSVEKLLTPKTRAILPVHLNGRTTNMDPVLEIAEKHDLLIIEDACQALGSSFKGKFAGTFGSAAAFSFYPSKTLGCFGDGGALVTNDDRVAEQARLLRDHGRTDDGNVRIFGFNARLDNLQAAILCHKLETYQLEIQRRREIASIYDKHLRHLIQLILPPSPDTESPNFDIYQNYEIEAENRDKLRNYLEESGIKTILQWGGRTINEFHLLNLKSELPYTDLMTERFMLLPLNTSLSDEDVIYICRHIDAFYS